MKKIICCLVLLICSWCGAVSAQEELTKDTCIAVMDFGTRPGATPEEININNAEYISCEYMIAGFVDKNCFKVVDKEVAMNALKEKGLQTTGIIDPDTAKKIGDVLNVRYIVYGNVNNVSVGEDGVALLGAGVNVCTVKANIIARIMDVSTGRIITMARGEGKSKSSYVNVAVGGDPSKAKMVTIGTFNVTQDSVHNAIAKAADHTVDDILFKLFKIKAARSK